MGRRGGRVFFFFFFFFFVGFFYFGPPGATVAPGLRTPGLGRSTLGSATRSGMRQGCGWHDLAPPWPRAAAGIERVFIFYFILVRFEGEVLPRGGAEKLIRSHLSISIPLTQPRPCPPCTM